MLVHLYDLVNVTLMQAIYGCMQPSVNINKMLLLTSSPPQLLQIVFSLLANSFSEQQQISHQDNIEISLVLQYNNHHNIYMCKY